MKILLTGFLSVSFVLIFCIPGAGQDFIKLEGKILQAGSKEGIPFASIGIPEKGLGNLSNETGDFELKIPANYLNEKVCISALGFKAVCLPASGIKGKKPTVFLKPANLQLATIEVKALSAANLVKEAIKRIPENYAAAPVHYTFYQRQLQNINKKPAYIIESVNETYRDQSRKENQLKILKSRGMATSAEYQKRMEHVWVSVYSILAYDNLLNQPDYLHPSKSKNFTYQLEKEDQFGNDTVLVISFKPTPKKNGEERPGTEGKLYLHNRSYAIVRLERQDNAAEIASENRSLGRKAVNKACKCISTYQGNSATINYQQLGNKWYFSNALSQGFNNSGGESYPVPEDSHNISQLIVTQTKTENAPEIPETERVKPYRNHYSKAPKDMNAAYWQQYNVLPLPEGFQHISAQ